MSWVDLVILGLVGLGVLSGYRRGAVMQLFSWGGFIVGVIAGAFAATKITRSVNPSPNVQPIIVLVIWFGTAFLVEAIVAFGGSKVAAKVTAVHAKRADAILGSVVAATLSVVLAWMVGAPAERAQALAPAIKRSVILRAVYAVLPPPPNFVTALGNLLSKTGFPEVFAQLNPSLAPGVDPAPPELARAREILAARALTYKIEGDGCGGRVDGSGFPAQPNLVITAAHVVAGTRHTRIIESDGTSYAARVVYMDTDRDIAVLRAPSLPDRVLAVDPEHAPSKTSGAAIGYPGGGREKVTVARVRARTQARGRDIYSNHLVTRTIYVLRATVHQGNSGGPFVDVEGRVRGMIFAASAQNAEESYALAETEIQRALRKAAGKKRQVDTKACAI